MVTREEVLGALHDVIDPELNIDVVSLGLIRDVHIEDNAVHVTMTLTSPFCPLAGVLGQAVKHRVERLEGVGPVEVSLVW